jgi:hypothetical protein
VQRSFQLTLTTASTVYNLYTLMRAVTGAVPTDGILPDRVNRFSIQSDDSNQTANVFVGDSLLSSSQYGAKLAAGGSLSIGPTFGNGVCLRDFYLMGSADGTKVNVMFNSV